MLRLFILGLVMSGLVGVNAVSATPPEKTNRILHINSYHRGYIWSDGIEQGLRGSLSASGKKIDIYIEFLDTLRFPDLNQLTVLAEVFAIKHSKIHYDAIIVSDNNAFNFAVKYRDRIFPNTPLIFCGYNSFRPEVLEGITNITGINEEIDFTGTIDMALTVQPKTENLAFITSDYYASGKQNQERVETSIIPSYRGRYKITQLKNLYLQDIEQRLAQLPPRTLVFVFGDPLDNRDERFISLPEYYHHVAEGSNAPVYSFWDFTLNTGTMGGRIITGPDQGRLAAEITLKVLDGTPADSIPVVMKTPTSRVFDLNAMQRFGISEESLPAGSIVINQPDTFYIRNKKYVWVSLSIFITLSVMVLFLAILLRKSRLLSSRLIAESEERRKVEKASYAKDDLISNVSHELRTPMTTIREGVSQVLDGILGPTTDDQREFLSIVQVNAERLSRIIDDLLDISRIEAGSLEICKEYEDMLRIAKQVAMIFKPQADAKNLQIKTDFPDSIIEVRVDTDKIFQVWTNLVNNALKFTEQGHIELSIKERENRVICTVKDTGVGIKTEDIPKIFGKFYQVTRKKGQEKEGAGLGLPIARAIIESHGGTLSAESVPGQGSLFTFEIPKEPL